MQLPFAQHPFGLHWQFCTTHELAGGHGHFGCRTQPFDGQFDEHFGGQPVGQQSSLSDLAACARLAAMNRNGTKLAKIRLGIVSSPLSAQWRLTRSTCEWAETEVGRSGGQDWELGRGDGLRCGLISQAAAGGRLSRAQVHCSFYRPNKRQNYYDLHIPDDAAHRRWQSLPATQTLGMPLDAGVAFQLLDEFHKN